MFPAQRDIGAVVVLACITYLLLRNRIRISGALFLKSGDRQNRLLNIAFWSTFMASCLLYQTQQLYHRPLAYFILISLLAGIIAVEILCFERGKGKSQVWMILLQIFLLSASIRMGMFYEFPSLSGADAFFHAKQAQYIADTGSIPSFELAEKYAAYPVFHTAVAMTQVLTSLSLKSAIYCSIGLYTIVSTLFIYFVGQRIAGPKVGLLAVLLANVSTGLITHGALNMIPGSLVLAWFMLMLYLMLGAKSNPKNTAILIFITFMIVITHQLSTFIVLVSVMTLFLAARAFKALYRSPQPLGPNLLYVSLFIVTWLSYLMATPRVPGDSLFSYAVRIVKEAFSTAEFGAAGAVTKSVYVGLWSNILFELGYLILLFLSIGGILWWLSSRDNRKLSIAGPAVVLAMIAYGTAAVGLRTVIPGRWIPALTVFLVILASAYVVGLAPLVRPTFAKIATFSLVSLLTFFMITTPNVNKDNPFYAMDRAGRTQFKASEVSGISTLNEVYSGTIRTDSWYTSGITRQLEMNSQLEGFDEEYVNGITEEDSGTLVVVRNAVFEEPQRVALGPRQIIDRGFLERFETPKYSLVYANTTVTAHLLE